MFFVFWDIAVPTQVWLLGILFVFTRLVPSRGLLVHACFSRCRLVSSQRFPAGFGFTSCGLIASRGLFSRGPSPSGRISFLSPSCFRPSSWVGILTSRIDVRRFPKTEDTEGCCKNLANTTIEVTGLKWINLVPGRFPDFWQWAASCFPLRRDSLFWLFTSRLIVAVIVIVDDQLPLSRARLTSRFGSTFLGSRFDLGTPSSLALVVSWRASLGSRRIGAYQSIFLHTVIQSFIFKSASMTEIDVIQYLLVEED